MNLYEFNKIGYAGLPTLTDEQLELHRIQVILPFLQNNSSKYYLMLNNEAKYYTVYTYTGAPNPELLSKEIIDISKNLGQIKSIEKVDQALEFWIIYDDECMVFYLFDYTNGVIEIGESNEHAVCKL